MHVTDRTLSLFCYSLDKQTISCKRKGIYFMKDRNVIARELRPVCPAYKIIISTRYEQHAATPITTTHIHFAHKTRMYAHSLHMANKSKTQHHNDHMNHLASFLFPLTRRSRETNATTDKTSNLLPYNGTFGGDTRVRYLKQDTEPTRYCCSQTGHKKKVKKTKTLRESTR